MALWIDRKYVSLVSVRLDRFKQKTNDLWNFRCPYCGDSKKNKLKARGYLYKYKENVRYKCQNCSISASMMDFLTFMDHNLASQYKLECYLEKNPKKDEGAPELEIPDDTLDSSALVSIGCVPLSDLNDAHAAVQYVKSRKLPSDRMKDLYYIDDTSKFVRLNSAYKDRLIPDERLVIPFRDKLGKLSGVTCRALGPSSKRYLAIRLSQYPLIYGLDRVNLRFPVYVCEGAFDSMFIPNAIAVGGSDLGRVLPILKDTKVIFIFDNEPRNPQIVKIMEKYITRGSMVVWPKDWKYKDVNEAISSGMPVSTILDVIYTHTHDELKLKLAIRDWKKV